MVVKTKSPRKLNLIRYHIRYIQNSLPIEKVHEIMSNPEVKTETFIDEETGQLCAEIVLPASMRQMQIDPDQSINESQDSQLLVEEVFEIGYVYRIVRIADDMKPELDQENTRQSYVGSTVYTIDKRMIEHKSACRCTEKDKYYPVHVVMITEGLDNFRIEEIGQFRNVTRTQLCEEEAKEIVRRNSVDNGWNGKYGSIYCVHGTDRRRCVSCGGSAICAHRKRREYCVTCLGSQYCIHGRFRVNCVECDGTNICDHHRRKNDCSVCNQCPCCPQDPEDELEDEDHDADHSTNRDGKAHVRSSKNSKHLGTLKHKFNWRLFQMYWTTHAFADNISQDDKFDTVLTLMATPRTNDGVYYYRIKNHRIKVPNAPTFNKLESMIDQSKQLANIPKRDDDSFGTPEPKVKRVGRKVTIEFNAPLTHRHDCILKKGRPLNCAVCNPCTICDGVADTEIHRNSTTHLAKKARVDSGENIPCHTGHKSKCIRCNRCDVCQIPFIKSKAHLETSIHREYQAARDRLA